MMYGVDSLYRIRNSFPLLFTQCYCVNNRDNRSEDVRPTLVLPERLRTKTLTERLNVEVAQSRLPTRPVILAVPFFCRGKRQHADAGTRTRRNKLC